jgi:hypothetical protein
VDFDASDMPMTDKQMQDAEFEILNLRSVLGAGVPPTIKEGRRTRGANLLWLLSFTLVKKEKAMKSALTFCAILLLGIGLPGQTGASPKPGQQNSAASTRSASVVQSSHEIAMARVDPGNDGGTATAPSSAPANASNRTNEAATDSATPVANTSAAAPAAPARAEPENLEGEIQQLRDLVDSQSKELAATREQMKQQQLKMQTLETRLKASGASGSASSEAQSTEAASSAQHETSAALSAAPTAPAIDARAVAPSVNAEAQTSNETSDNAQVSPLQLKVGSAYITPVGFMDFTGVWRARDGGSGIGTNFAGIPYGNNGVFQANLSEFRFSMQNSRVGFRVDANVKGSHVIGYMESDFLGNNPTNVAVSSNSNTMRSRLYWVDVRRGAWELLGGQTWSLATPNRVGLSPLPGDVFFSYNMDVNYQVGMVWGRIPEFRVDYHFPDDKAAFAIAVDSPDQYMGGTNGSTAVTLPACCSYYAGGQLDNGTTTLNPPNRGPDVIAKFVADPSKRLHFEVGGIARFFQLYNQKSTTHYSATGGAGFVNLDFGVTKGLRLLTHNYWSDGGGRYIFGQAPDLIARADGSPSLVKSGSTVDGFEFTHQNTTLFGYWGAVYIKRNVATDSDGCNIGWGFAPSPSSLTGCASASSGQNRVIQEPTVGFIKNFWKDPKYGALSLIGQYSYLTRDPWHVAAGSPKHGFSSMAFLDLRYTLPGSAPTLGKPGKE